MVEKEIPLPPPGPGEIHLRVEAAGVNFADLLQRAGLYGKVPDLPYAPGFEVAGTVTMVGQGVETWSEGDRAVALLRFGGYAREVVLPADQAFFSGGGTAAMGPDNHDEGKEEEGGAEQHHGENDFNKGNPQKLRRAIDEHDGPQEERDYPCI